MSLGGAGEPVSGAAPVSSENVGPQRTRKHMKKKICRIIPIASCTALVLAVASVAAAPASDTIIFEKWLPDPSGEYWGYSVELWSVRSDGTDLRRLTSGAYDTGASWSPDRMRIAFSRSDVGIMVLRLDDLSLSEFRLKDRAHDPVWLDTETILYAAAAGPEEDFSKSWRLFSVSLSERSPKLLETEDLQGVFSPTVAADRQFLAFRAWENGTPKVFIAEVADVARTRKAISKGGGFPVAWTPDSTAVAILSDTQCATVTRTGRVSRSFSDVQECQLSWSPSGEHVVFLHDAELWIMDSDGKNRHLLIKPNDGSHYHGPVWR